MGLDMYAYSRSSVISEDINFNYENTDTEIQYWRKNNYLHGWMNRLYKEKGGTEEFNCVNLQLTEKDLKKLRKDIKDTRLQFNEGFFWGGNYDYYNGDYRGSQAQVDLEFVKTALKLIKEGNSIYYSSWW
jgi:hypothetical protein